MLRDPARDIQCILVYSMDCFFLPSFLQDFGSIFSTLLPGTSACLSPLEGQTVLEGLEVRVAFGEVWKESLQELSGGQRCVYVCVFGWVGRAPI